MLIIALAGLYARLSDDDWFTFKLDTSLKIDLKIYLLHSFVSNF